MNPKIKIEYKIHSEGNSVLVIMALIFSAVSALLFWLIPWIWLPIVITVLLAITFGMAVNFFRSPVREFAGDRENAVVSSVDGVVVAIEEVFEDEYLHAKAIQLSVFMNIFNVHANWFPIDGKVLFVRHHNGRYLSAYLPKASSDNERSTVAIQAENGQIIVMRQIAGAVARRVVTYAKEGDTAHIDQHMGFIKFGSRVDLYLPIDAEILVKLNDHVTGDITQVARLKAKPVIE